MLTGVGQPMRTQEQPYPDGWAAGASGNPASAAVSRRDSRSRAASASAAGRSPRAPHRRAPLPLAVEGRAAFRRNHWAILLSLSIYRLTPRQGTVNTEGTQL